MGVATGEEKAVGAKVAQLAAEVMVMAVAYQGVVTVAAATDWEVEATGAVTEAEVAAGCGRGTCSRWTPSCSYCRRPCPCSRA